MLVVHLRWTDPGPDRFAELVRAVPGDGALPPGCLSRRLQRGGGALVATETWDDEQSGGRVDDLVTAVRTAGIEEPPQVAMFSVPSIFAVAYRRPAVAAVHDVPRPAVIPEQRQGSSLEQLPAGAADARI